LAFKKTKKFHGDTAQPHLQGPAPERPDKGEETDLQQRYRHLDHTSGLDNPGLAGTVGRRRNNAANPHVARTFPKNRTPEDTAPSETQITSGR
jgi:hypothetical protein